MKHERELWHLVVAHHLGLLFAGVVPCNGFHKGLYKVSKVGFHSFCSRSRTGPLKAVFTIENSFIGTYTFLSSIGPLFLFLGDV